MSQPPSTGPSTAASPLTPPMRPYIGARSRGLKSACTDASSCGTMSAANSPCAMRVATSASPDQAAAAAADARVNPAMPMRNTRRRPNRSPNRPPVISATANASM